jgi:hypothetical protein
MGITAKPGRRILGLDLGCVPVVAEAEAWVGVVTCYMPDARISDGNVCVYAACRRRVVVPYALFLISRS